MKVLTVANQKGGTGKSTITILLACCLASEGKEVVILDIDSQSTISLLYELEETAIFEVFKINSKEVKSYIEQLRKTSCDYIFIDFARFTKDNDLQVEILKMCEVAFVPILGGMIDLISTNTFLNTLRLNNIENYTFLNKATRRLQDAETLNVIEEKNNIMINKLSDLTLFKKLSFEHSILGNKEGQKRFKPFYDEFKNLISN